MNRKVLIYGLVYGLTSVISYFFMYKTDMGMWTNVLLGQVVFIVLAVMYVRTLRKVTGVSPFKTILKDLMLIVLIGTVLSLVINQIFILSLSEDEKIAVQESFVEKQLASPRAMGIPEEDLYEIEDQLLENADQMFSIKSSLYGLPVALGMMFVFCVIIGLIMKKEPDVDASELLSNT